MTNGDREGRIFLFLPYTNSGLFFLLTTKYRILYGKTWQRLPENLRDKLFYDNRRVAEIQIFEKTYLIVIKDETGLKFKMNDSTLFLIWSYAQKLVASY